MEPRHKHTNVPRQRNLAVRLRSSVPGRMRWDAEELRDRPRKAAAVEITLQQMTGVHSVEATPLTGRLLVRYNADLSPQEMTAMVHAALSTPALSPEAYAALNSLSNGQRHIGVPLHAGHSNGHTHDHEVDDASLRGHTRRLFLGGSVLFGLLVKRLVTGAGPLAAHPALWAITAITTLVSGLPFLRGAVSSLTNDEVLSLAANGELHSQHPLALAVLKYAQDRQIVIPLHDECEILVGRGVRADWAGNRILVGTGQMLEQFGVSLPAAAEAQHASYTAAGESVMYVAHQDQLIGLIGVRDKVRPEAIAAVTQLSAMGVPHLVMLSGDIEETARIVARAVGIKDWRAQLSPEQKYDLIREFRARGRRVAMVGDGINDAPALALADVGIAMGTVGSDVAIEAADIAVASDNLHQVATTVRLSRQTLQVVRQNYGMALCVNAGGIAFGAFGLLNPFLAAILHNLSTLLVVLNSARLIRYDPDRRTTPTSA